MNLSLRVVTAALLGTLILASPLPAQTVDTTIQQGLSAYQQGHLSQARDQLLNAVIMVQNRMPFDINRVVFCKDIQGYDDFTPMETDYLPHGQQLLMYIEPVNVTIRTKPDRKYEIWFSEDIVLTNSAGDVLLEKKNWINLHQISGMPPLVSFIRNTITDIPVGQYTIDLTVNDLLGKKLATKRVELTVK